MSDATTGSGVAPAPRLLGGRYEVGALLGRGGMAEVHVAQDLRLGRTVAVKLLRSDLARDPSFQARFRREAQSAAGLNHPSIVAVYDTGADKATEFGGASVDLPWIVMEYVEGRTLRDMLRSDHPLAIGESLTITEGVLGALEYSHRMGIVHRDIKPANVMITPAGEVKVMDFGIARAVSDSSATLTQTSAVMGTAQYLSPEQARGEQVDSRSDLYSAGCLLYEILTGRPPFVGDAPVAVAYQHVSEQPKPPSAFAPQISPAVDHVVLMALSKDREHRYQSAGDFADDLRRAVEGRPLRGASFGAPAATQQFQAVPPVATTTLTPVVPAPAPVPMSNALPRVDDDDIAPEEEKRRRWPWVVLIVALVLGLATAGYELWRGGGDATTSPTVSAAPTAVDVPDVVGSTQEEANTTLTGAQLVPTFVPTPDDNVAQGSVIDTDPVAGTSVAPGGTVTVRVSTGPDAVKVPDVRGQSQQAARTALTNAGFTVGDVNATDADPSADKNTVVSTDPAADASAARGTAVTLNLASGQVEVPDVTGQTLEAAVSALQEQRLQVNSSEDPDASGDPGTVSSQSLSAGTKVDVGAPINLVVVPEETATSTPTDSPTPSEEPSLPTTSPSSTASGTSTRSGTPTPTGQKAKPAKATGGGSGE
ncbi:MAG: Stk1 family PASTA domain-containing Ser/Thr kinase [Janthinobacterium lividum]